MDTSDVLVKWGFDEYIAAFEAKLIRMLQLALIGVVVVVYFYYYAIKPMSYWKERGIEDGNPLWLFGHQCKQFFGLENIADVLKKVYDGAPDSRYTGMYQFTTPALVIRDPALLKRITVKDFEHFVNHKMAIPDGADPLWSKNLLSLKDQRWKQMRPVLSPFFTTSKMKMMYTLMAGCSENLVKYFMKKDKNFVEISMKEITSQYSNDIIALTAFGIHMDSLKEPNNDFYLMGKHLTDFTPLRRSLKAFGFVLMPKLFTLLNIHFFDGVSREYFIDLIENCIKKREEQNIAHPDVINLLLEARKGIKCSDEYIVIEDREFDNNNGANLGKPAPAMSEITNEEIIAQALVFFFAGFDSVSNLMSFMSYELAMNPDIQTRLIEEIDEVFKQCNGKLTYQELTKMKYMDMVISESLRKWPNFPVLDRICTKKYVIEPESVKEKRLVIEEGQILLFPLTAIHHDPKYFPDPERFDPERFSHEDKDKIVPYTYFPFGLGPRNCIGARYALLENKVFFAHLLHNFEIVPTSKTSIPVELSKTSFNLKARDSMQLGLKRRRQ